MTLAELTACHGRTWTISGAVGGGWYAVRRAALSVYARAHGLSDIRCGATLDELAHRLEAETRLERQAWRRIPARPMS
ncbi:hypothetical protein FHS43_000769 [Streptosporangium becharense]|uniref:Uncharacterized protein n=1 Tax=Streptosporangium becharense TaxID=1816182 RepID=A0A7W9MG58_9ACTN|nr:hypothetical protein [Streptosporangium becharense]MBB2909523.1 hypothetical protein [Streptosporangium becharense]MBB5819520.1 hypothetical protein [Streptosporangium becharense]